MPHGETEVTTGDIFSVFDREVLRIRRAWEFWQILDETPRSLVLDWSTLRGIAPTFYRCVQECLLQFVVLGVARLADKDPRTVSLEAVWEAAGCHGGHGEKAMRMALEIIGSPVFRKARDRELAHLNLATATGAKPTEPLYLTTPPPGEFAPAPPGEPSSKSEENRTILKAVDRVAAFNEHVKAARRGTPLEIGGGPHVDPADVAPCLTEMRILVDRLNRGADMKGGDR